MVLSRPVRRRNSILLTSLVDVLFVLLFFFMLTSSVLDWRSVTIDAGPPVAAGDAADAPLLEVLPGRQLRLGEDAFAFDALSQRLSQQGVRSVTVQPAPGVPLQDLVDVVEVLRRGAVGLRLARAAP